jgi:HD superfamily phosphohydrolase
VEKTAELAKSVAGSLCNGENVCFFLGSGAAIDSSLAPDLRLPNGQIVKSRLMSLPGAPDEEALKTRLGVDILTPELVWASIVETKRSSVRLDILRNLFEYSQDQLIPVPSTYRFVAKLAVRQTLHVTVLTTNFDEKIDTAFRDQIRASDRSRKLIAVTASSDDDFKHVADDLNTMLNHPVVFKLHGTLSKAHSIVSTVERAKRLSEQKSDLLRKVVKRSDVIVFVGYTGADEDIRNGLKASLEEVTNPEQKRLFWVLHRRGSNIHLDMKTILTDAATNGIRVEYPVEVDSHVLFRGIWRELDSLEAKEPSDMGLVEADKDFCTVRCSRVIDHPMDSLPDPIYGRIQLAPELIKVVDSGAIQRLRNIKQLSMAYYAFPDATHTRFSHSLGVAHLMKSSLEQIRDREDNCGNPVIDRNLLFDSVLAALLHDIGHGPFGHAVDIFMGRVKTDARRNHEDFTVDFVTRGLLDLAPALGKVSYKKDRVVALLGRQAISPDLYAVRMLLSNKGFDLDRFDFLLRDLYHAGVDVKEANLSGDLYSAKGRDGMVKTMLSSISIRDTKHLPPDERREHSEGTSVVCFKNDDMVKSAIEDFFKLYVMMYNYVYYRDVNRAAQAMVSKALSFAHDIGELEVRSIHAHTDQELFSLLEQSPDNRVRELANCVKYRYLFEAMEFAPRRGIAAIDIERRLVDALGLREQGIDDMLIVDIAPPKEIDYSAYLYDGKDIVKHHFDFREHRSFRKEMNKLRRPKGHVCVPPSLVRKLDSIQKHLEPFCLVKPRG